jgi:hypothetical protein
LGRCTEIAYAANTLAEQLDPLTGGAKLRVHSCPPNLLQQPSPSWQELAHVAAAKDLGERPTEALAALRSGSAPRPPIPTTTPVAATVPGSRTAPKKRPRVGSASGGPETVPETAAGTEAVATEARRARAAKGRKAQPGQAKRQRTSHGREGSGISSAPLKFKRAQVPVRAVADASDDDDGELASPPPLKRGDGGHTGPWGPEAAVAVPCAGHRGPITGEGNVAGAADAGDHMCAALAAMPHEETLSELMVSPLQAHDHQARLQCVPAKSETECLHTCRRFLLPGVIRQCLLLMSTPSPDVHKLPM